MTSARHFGRFTQKAMKAFCRQCGCHFPEDFAETQEQDCNWWLSRGFPLDFEVEHEEWARKLWDHMFGIDMDALGDETGIMISFGDLRCLEQRYEGNQFEGKDPNGPVDDHCGYTDWPDEKRRRFQKAFFKYQYSGKMTSDAYQRFQEQWAADELAKEDDGDVD